jgi:hypothetical protein
VLEVGDSAVSLDNPDGEVVAGGFVEAGVTEAVATVDCFEADATLFVVIRTFFFFTKKSCIRDFSLSNCSTDL